MSLATPVDEVILQAMRKPEDRIFFLQYEAQMVDFIHDAARPTLDLPPMNTYQRLLVRRCADQFRLTHHLDRLSHIVTVSKTADSFLPDTLLSDRAKGLLDESASSSSASTPPSANATSFKIMRRDPSNGRARSSRDNSDSETITSKTRKDMTIQEREASYKAARARIFGDEELEAPKVSPCASTSSLDVAPNRARLDDDVDFSRALPQPSHSHPNLRAKAPAFHPPGYSTPPTAQSRAHIQQMNGVNAWAQQTASCTQQTSTPLYSRDASSSRQSSRTTPKAPLAAHPSLPAKPTWLQPSPTASSPSSSTPSLTLHNSTSRNDS